MSFWDSELGDITGNAEDAFSKSFTQIPDGTSALAKIEKFTNKVNMESGFKYLNIDWVLTEGDFKGQRVSQKLKVFGGDQLDKDSAKTRHRALNMLKLLYQLFNIQPKHTNPPTDQDLASFIGKIGGLKIRETAPNEKGRQYNWVAEVHKAQGFKSETGAGLPVIAQASINSYQPLETKTEIPFTNNYSSNSPDLSDVPF